MFHHESNEPLKTVKEQKAKSFGDDAKPSMIGSTDPIVGAFVAFSITNVH